VLLLLPYHFFSHAELVLVVHPSNDAPIDIKTAQEFFLEKKVNSLRVREGIAN